jgi:hypothetical protein
MYVAAMRRILVVVVLAVAACGGDTDGGAELACRDFRAVARDVQAGVVAPSELRPKLQKIWGNAKLSDDARIRSAGQDMLAASTAGDDGELADAVTRFGNACQDYTDL